MQFTKWLLVFLSIHSLSAGADSKPLFPVLACPAVGDEYEKMISKLDAIKTSIRRDANCEKVELKVKELEELVTTNREQVMEIIANAQGQSLTPEQSKQVREYAENVTKKVSAMNDLFTRSNYCFKEDKPQNSLTSLAGFVGEAANMVGSVSGPWGTPIALAGNVVAGFLTGLDQILKSRAGYDFSDRDQWVSYVQNLCTYHKYRDQVEHLLNPRARISQLQTFKTKLDAQIQIMSRDCGDCQTIMQAFESRKDLDESGLMNLLNRHIQSADQRFAKPYGTYMIQSLGLRNWAVGELQRIQKESSGYWAEASGRHLLTQAKADIEQFLLSREAPKFISYGVSTSREEYHTFSYTVAREGRMLYAAIDLANRDILAGRLNNPGWTDPMSVFRALVVQPLDWEKMPRSPARDELQFAWTHFRDHTLDRFRMALTSAQMVQTFCTFFKHSGFYSPALRGQCSAAYFKKQVDEQNQLASELSAANVNLGPLHGAQSSAETESLTPLEAMIRAIENRGLGR